MKLVTFAVSTLALSFAALAGCAAHTEAPAGDDQLGTSDSQLVADEDESSSADADQESGIDDPLSGADPASPGMPASGSQDDVMAKVRTNPGRFFQPAGCLTTTVSGNVATHVFDDCTGPYGLVHFNGTITSTYVRDADKLTITHAADGFQINGATISGQRVVVYEIAGSVVTKTRTGNWTGTTAKGNAISHTASFVSTYDDGTKCVTRDGSADTSVGGRDFSMAIKGYKRCGIGNLGCPDSGEIDLSRTKNQKTADVTIEFLGGRKYTVTLPSGREVTLGLVCRASS